MLEYDSTFLLRFWGFVNKSESCWIWMGCHNVYGYGVIRVPLVRKLRMAHRIAYELTIGPISTGLTLDHLCRVRECVNPTHLEAVTRGENVLRGESPAAQAARKTHCVNGHPLIEENLYRDGTCVRRCRTCVLERQRLKRIERGQTGTVNYAKTHCPKGHPYSGSNLRVKSSGARGCRACDEASWRDPNVRARKNAKRREKRATANLL